MRKRSERLTALLLTAVVATGILSPAAVGYSGSTGTGTSGATLSAPHADSRIKPFEVRAYVKTKYAARLRIDMNARGLRTYVAAKRVPTTKRALNGRIASVKWAGTAVDPACGHFGAGRTLTVRLYQYRAPVTYYTSGSGVERWRPAIRRELKRQRVYSKFAENKLLHIMRKESRGNPKARNGQHLGLFQFNRRWSSASNRLSGKWSIQRVVRVYKVGGTRKLRQHWAATYR